ncbi:MAG: argininosuccinate synthase [Armatimonadota bacterium]|nr:argininosuccinate synthase [Armatimonadota bacterium]MDR7439770.1 argininosuccinate synthase [Armatimonadota bacterium]MDR7562269.1 argininosuccinate synthase [Armatimonadota bacterium]MDR7602667.1 argininosuccinate synthase [Armatimonadota bacterium]
MEKVRKVALAYSGGLDTSVAIPWLRERYGCEVVAVVADVGQLDDFDALRRKALQSGATSCHVVDVREEFVRDYCFRALRAGAVYEGRYLLGTALARPLIAKVQVEVARATGCDALAHGCTGKGNDQVRFELTYRALAPDLRVIAPWREWELRSREDELRYAQEHGVPVPVTAEKPYSIDQNLWHTSYEGGVLEDPAVPPPEEMFQLTVDPRRAPDTPQRLEIAFERGIPVAVDGVRMTPAQLVHYLNRVAGAHGVGRVDMVENRLVGMKSRGVYETPAGTVLTTALRDLEAITLDRDTVRFKELVAARYADLVYSGLWYSPLREALDAFLESTHRYVTGTVTVELYRGHCWAVSRSSPYSLYRQDLATFGEGAAYDHRDATGFIRLWGLPTQVYAAVHPEAQKALEEAPAGPKP